MPSYLTVSVRRRDRSIVVHVGGELDLASSRRLEQALEEAWRSSPDELLIDLAKLHFMDMAGLRVLLDANQRAERRGTQFALTNVRDPIRRVLTLARVNGLMPIRGNGTSG